MVGSATLAVQTVEPPTVTGFVLQVVVVVDVNCTASVAVPLLVECVESPP